MLLSAESFVWARVVHVVAVLLWIGGVAMVTLVLLPAVREFASVADRVAFFEKVERRFARQSRYTTLLAGLSGFYMISVADLWGRFGELQFWWLHGMVAVWLLFTLMLFVAEPLFLHRWFIARAQQQPQETFALILRMHRLLLLLSLVVTAGAVAGSHGWMFG